MKLVMYSFKKGASKTKYFHFNFRAPFSTLCCMKNLFYLILWEVIYLLCTSLT